MATITQTEYQYPTSVTTGNTTGNGWTNPNSILLPDDACAVSNANQASDITVGNFSGISLPQNAVITGIGFKIRASGDSSASLTFYAYNTANGASDYFPYTAPFMSLTPNLEYYEFGGSSYLFGQAWTPDMINNFRLQIVANGNANIDIVEATVFYYIPDSTTAPVVIGTNCADCNSQIQVLPFQIVRNATANDRYIYVDKFQYPDGDPIQVADLGACGGYVDITLNQGVPKGNGGNFMENIRVSYWRTLPNSTVIELDTVDPTLYRGLGFKTPYGPSAANRSAHDIGEEAVISNNAPFYDRFLKKCHVGVLVSDLIEVDQEGLKVAKPVKTFNFKGASVQVTQHPGDATEVDVEIITSPTHTDPTIGTTGSGTTGTTQATTLTIARTITTENYLRVWVSTENHTISSVTDNGNAMTLITSNTDAGNNLKGALYGIINPAAGAHNIVITMATASYISAGFVAFNDVDTANPSDTSSAATTGNSTAPSISVTTSIQNVVMQDVVITESNPTIFTQTLPWNIVSQVTAGTRQGASAVRKVLAPSTLTDTYAITPTGHWIMLAAGVRGTSITSTGVQSVTGQYMDNTDPANVVSKVPRANGSATTDPAVGNDVSQGYQIGSLWMNTDTNRLFICEDASTGAAAWNEVAIGAGGSLTVKKNGTVISSSATILNFLSSSSVTDVGGGQVNVTIPAGGSGGGTKLAIDTTFASAGTTETTLYAENIPAGTLSSNNAIRFNMLLSNFVLTSPGTSGTQSHAIIRAKYGGTTFATCTISTPPTTQAIWTFGSSLFQGMLVAQGTAGTQIGQCDFIAESYPTLSTSDINGISVDSTIDQDLVITAEVSSGPNVGGVVPSLDANGIIIERISGSGSAANAPEQNIGGINDSYANTLSVPVPSISSYQDGSVIFTLQIASSTGATAFITRYQRDANTGIYRKTNQASVSSLGSPVFNQGIAIDEINGFIYVPAVGKRYDAADLSNPTSISGISGSTICYYSPGVYLSISFDSPNWKVQIFTLSGTSFTPGSFCSGFTDGPSYGIMTDTATGVIYICDTNGGIQAFTLSGTTLTPAATALNYQVNGMLGGQSNQPFGIGLSSGNLMYLVYSITTQWITGSGTSTAPVVNNNSMLLKVFTRPS